MKVKSSGCVHTSDSDLTSICYFRENCVAVIIGSSFEPQVVVVVVAVGFKVCLRLRLSPADECWVQRQDGGEVYWLIFSGAGREMMGKRLMQLELRLGVVALQHVLSG